LISAASAVSSGTSNSGSTSPMQRFGATKGQNSTCFMSNPFASPKSIQIGSSNIAKPNWRLPQSVTMGLVGMIGSSNSLQTADLVVSVVPFTGKSTQNGTAFK